MPENQLNLVKIIQEIALATVTSEEVTYEYYHRQMCRRYSILFSTPLADVKKLPFDEVIREVKEHEIESIMQSEDDSELIYKMKMAAIDPDFEQNQADADAEFEKMILQQESDKIKSIKEANKNLAPPIKKVYDDQVPPESKKATTENDDGLDFLVDGIGSGD